MKAAIITPTHRRPQLVRSVVRDLHRTPPPWGWEVRHYVVPSPEDDVTGITRIHPRVVIERCSSTWVGRKLQAATVAADKWGAELVLRADDDDLQPRNRISEAIQAYQRGHEYTGISSIRTVDLRSGLSALWIPGPEFGLSALVGTSIGISMRLLKVLGGWPQKFHGIDGALLDRIRKKAPEIQVYDLVARTGPVTSIYHGANLWTRTVPQLHELKRQHRHWLVGEGPWVDVESITPEHKAILAQLEPLPSERATVTVV